MSSSLFQRPTIRKEWEANQGARNLHSRSPNLKDSQSLRQAGALQPPKLLAEHVRWLLPLRLLLSDHLAGVGQGQGGLKGLFLLQGIFGFLGGLRACRHHSDQTPRALSVKAQLLIQTMPTLPTITLHTSHTQTLNHAGFIVPALR